MPHNFFNMRFTFFFLYFHRTHLMSAKKLCLSLERGLPVSARCLVLWKEQKFCGEMRRAHGREQQGSPLNRQNLTCGVDIMLCLPDSFGFLEQEKSHVFFMIWSIFHLYEVGWGRGADDMFCRSFCDRIQYILYLNFLGSQTVLNMPWSLIQLKMHPVFAKSGQISSPFSWAAKKSLRWGLPLRPQVKQKSKEERLGHGLFPFQIFWLQY